MIDTIKGYIDVSQYNKAHFNELLKHSTRTKKENGYTKTINLSNFKITVTFKHYKPQRLLFNGSLPKFYYGTNLIHLDWNTTKDAIQMLSDNLNVDISNAVLTRVDFGINIPLRHSVHEYTDCLLHYPRLATTRHPDTVTFFSTNGNLSIIFYNKIAEINHALKKTNKKIKYDNITYKKKDTCLPYFNSNKKVLRYEIQLKKSLKTKLQLKHIKAKDLYCDTVQNKLIENWFDSYNKVHKISLGTDPDYLIKEHNGLQKYLSYHGLEKLEYDRIISKISKLNFEVKNNRVKRSKMRGSIKKLLKDVEENGLDKGILDELNNKIIYIKDYILLNKSVPYFNSEKDLENYY